MTNEWKRCCCLAWLLVVYSISNAATPNVAGGGRHTVALKNDGTVVTVNRPGFSGELRV